MEQAIMALLAGTLLGAVLMSVSMSSCALSASLVCQMRYFDFRMLGVM